MKYDANRIDELVKTIISITPKDSLSWGSFIFPYALRMLIMKFVMDIDDNPESPEQMLNELNKIYNNLNDAIDNKKT